MSGPLSSAIREQIAELDRTVSGSMMARKMWREIMTKDDRRKLLQIVDQEPRDPELDDDPALELCSLQEELIEGSVGKLLHRCFYRWGAVGMWMKSRHVSRSRAVAELAFEYGLLNEAGFRRLLLGLGEVEHAHSDPRLTWKRDTGELRLNGHLVRRVEYPSRASNLVTVLDSFEELGWPDRIDDPLPHGSDKQRLRETVRSLNQGLSEIRFRADGTGTGIVRETAQTRATPAPHT